MHLLHVQELKVEEFNDDQKRPPYAILSHTWENDEVSFQDIQTPEAVSMAGYAKILKCCEIAKQDGFEYVWIDTCCINKTSSSELSEAINSMYKWYRVASVCYVFLSDVESEDNHHDSESQFRRSRWFTRGWTLQELLAPEVLVFHNQKWVEIGTKHTLQKTISEITKIPRKALIDADSIKNFSIAVRMSWASHRRTTREEDRGYSLMGIFGVNMPPLYGEGTNAFKRLQLEIIKESQDESIFAWSAYFQSKWTPLAYSDSGGERLLASTPRYFQDCHGVIYNDQYQSTPPFSMSNRGLHIWLPVIHFKNKFEEDGHLALLNCMAADGGRLGILLTLQSGSGSYFRSSLGAYIIEKDDLNTVEKPTELYITAQETGPNPLLSRYQICTRSTFHFLENTSPETGYHLQYFFDGSKGSGLDGPPSRTCTFNEAQKADADLYMMYLVVRSIQDPNIQTVIVLGNHQDRDKVANHYCRVFMGSIIPSTLTKITNSVSFREKQIHFSKIFPGDEFQYFPNNKITKHLITITVRTGPATGMENPYYDVGDHNYRVHIMFSLPLFRDKPV